MGGGNVKMLTVAFLWVGLQSALTFVLSLLVFILVHIAVVRLGWAKVQEVHGSKRIPFCAIDRRGPDRHIHIGLSGTWSLASLAWPYAEKSARRDNSEPTGAA
jgi:hypothetical protein